MSWAAGAALLAWLVMLFGRGMFWLGRENDTAPAPESAAWPAVTILVPARDEAPTIGTVVRALLAQDYPGEITLWVVDDRSSDGTGDLARAAGNLAGSAGGDLAGSAGGDARLGVVTGGPRPPGWTGKLWALQQGLDAARPTTPYLLFTDADIAHAPDSLRRLVARAEAHGLALTSLMAKLRCESQAEKWFIPAFIYFFQMLYPFAWANDPRARTAAAAGGCVLLRRDAFEAAGGLASIRGAMIDDCSLARLIKRAGGKTWLGLTERVVSLRECPDITPIRRMVARTAYAQLRYSPILLLAMIAALGFIFLLPPWLTIFGNGDQKMLGGLAWAAMAGSFAPTLRRYRLGLWRGATLPVIALFYMAFTVESAVQQHRGRGGMWKGEPGPAPL